MHAVGCGGLGRHDLKGLQTGGCNGCSGCRCCPWRRMGLDDGTGEMRRVQYTGDDNGENTAAYPQQDVTLLHGSSLKVVSISPCEPGAFLVPARQARRSE